MTSNQKLLALSIAVVASFFLLSWAWIAVLAGIVLLIVFRDPLWDAAQWLAKVIFPQKKPKMVEPAPKPAPLEPDL